MSDERKKTSSNEDLEEASDDIGAAELAAELIESLEGEAEEEEAQEPPIPEGEGEDPGPGSELGVEAGSGEKGVGSMRRLYKRELSGLEVDARVVKAREASEAILLALCFDPDPRVIRAVLDNSRSGLEHGRLIAEHHRTSTGLGHLGRKAAMIRDRQVQRRLFRNPQTSEPLFEKLVQPKRMADAYRLAISRDVTERVKSSARKAFRKKFGSGGADEKVSLILKTEGRCLPMLIGVPLDGRAASLLTRRPIHSTLLVQNLARWPATPPAVLVHLSKQPAVRRTASLRNLLRRHPNAPSELKR